MADQQKLRAAVYGRLSRLEFDEQGRIEQHANLDDQAAKGEDTVRDRGWQLVETIIETDRRNGAKENGRPGMQRLLGLIDSGKIDVVVTRDLDRLWRDTIKALGLKAVAHIVTTDGAVDTIRDEHSGNLSFTLRAAIAEEEYRVKRNRVVGMRKRLADAGRPRIGGWRAYGFEVDGVTLRPDEQAVIRESANVFVRTTSLRAAVRHWTENGILNSKKKSVAPQTVRNVLLHAEDYGVSEDVAERARAILQDPSRRTNQTGENRRKFMLNGIVFCGNCGAKMYGAYKRHHRGAPKVAYYRCRTCTKNHIVADNLDRTVWRLVEIERRFVSGEGFKPLANGEDAALREKLTDLEARAENKRADYADDLIDARTLKAALAKIEGEVSEVRRQLADLARAEAARESLRGWTERLSKGQDADEMRLITAQVIERVTVAKGDHKTKLKPSQRIEITWAPGRGFPDVQAPGIKQPAVAVDLEDVEELIDMLEKARSDREGGGGER